MPSPFPGMNPYLEGYLWSDVHNALASKISTFLAPQLHPEYVAQLEVYVVEDIFPSGMLYPDMEVSHLKHSLVHPSTATSPTDKTDAPPTLSLIQTVPVPIPTVEIRDTANNALVNCIEILSPVNKKEPGITQYRKKSQRLYDANVHLIEIDLLRQGNRPFKHPRFRDVPYLISLRRSHFGMFEVWPVALQDPLPIIPVPLGEDEPDALLNLQAALHAIYDEESYDLLIDYTEPPPPPTLSNADQEWMSKLLEQHSS